MTRLLLFVSLLVGSSFGLQLPEGFFNKDPRRNWAVLVAGSEGWGNYRHQADVCHAYQLLRKLGIPAENIVTFMYDDIANNPQNPAKGQIFNDYSHKNVYDGVRIDYRGLEVNPNMLQRVMLGDPQLKAQGRKVLTTNADDNIFFYYSDHGGPGVLSLPAGALYAQDLYKILNNMYRTAKYNEMVLYIEACYSGSMFEMEPPRGIKVYATTAANAHESSYAYFCRDPLINTCLSDEYSYHWMTDTESNNPRSRKLIDQYYAVRSQTKMSHVMQYGDSAIGQEVIGNFQAGNGVGMSSYVSEVKTHDDMDESHFMPAIRAHMVPLLRAVMEANSEEQHKLAERKLHRAIQLGKMVEQIFEDIAEDVEKRLVATNNDVSVEERMDCFKTVLEEFQSHCFKMQRVPEVIQHLDKFHKMCQAGYKPEELAQSVVMVCP